MRFVAVLKLIYGDLNDSTLARLNAKCTLAIQKITFPNTISKIFYVQKWSGKIGVWEK